MTHTRLHNILRAVSIHTGTSIDEIRERHGRHPRVTRSRELITLCARNLTGASFPVISQFVTGTRKRHSTYLDAYTRAMANRDRVAEADQIARRIAQ